MSVVVSLLRAIDRADGEALVMHVGEKPYVVTATGHAELTAKALTIPAMTGMLDQLLPTETRHALDELGAVEYHLPTQPGFAPDFGYTVVAARGGDDIWIEVRRRKREPEPGVAHQSPQIHQGVQAVHAVQPIHATPAAAAVAVAEPERYVLETSGPIVVDEPSLGGVVEVERDLMIHEPAPEPDTVAVAEADYPEGADLTMDPVLDPVISVAADPEPVFTAPPVVQPIVEPPAPLSEEPPAMAVDDRGVIAFDEPDAITGSLLEDFTIDEPDAVPGEDPHVMDFDEPPSVEVEPAALPVATAEAAIENAAAPQPSEAAAPGAAVPATPETTVPEAILPTSMPTEAAPRVTATSGHEPEAIAFALEAERLVAPVTPALEPKLIAAPPVAAPKLIAARVEPEPSTSPREPELPTAAREPEPSVVRDTHQTMVAEAAAERVVEIKAPTDVRPVLRPEHRDDRDHTSAVVHPPAVAPDNVPAELDPRMPMPPDSMSQPRGEGLPHLLRIAAAQGASVLYVAVQAKPSLRVDGEIRVLEHETPLTEALLEQGLEAILPTGTDLALGEVEICDVPGVGRVQCLSFRDHRGLGAMFKMLPARAISAEQMGLGAPIQALCTETEGLVLVAGARGAGKSTLVAALVDQMNRTRRDHVITVEQQIQFVHENRQSFVSQREAREDDVFAEAVRSALRESPDVLVVDQVASSEAATFALHAAASGHLVVASITAPTTAGAVSRFMEFFGEDRTQARLTLGEHLRGVITQTLLRKTGGGRAAAREVLVNVPTVAAMIAGGEFDQLGSMLNGGRRVGMVPLNDALLALVQSGALDVREAYRKSPDQQEFVGQLNRAGVDTAFTERLA